MYLSPFSLKGVKLMNYLKPKEERCFVIVLVFSNGRFKILTYIICLFSYILLCSTKDLEWPMRIVRSIEA